MISANTLFHFTNSIESLRSILTYTFVPRYCLERLDLFSKKDKIDLAIPMVCFCDIPLSQITEHISKYGNYAIGLTKEWALSKGISPIFYIPHDSRTNVLLRQLSLNSSRLDGLKMLLKKEDPAEATLEFMELFFYCKNYRGSMWRNNELIKDIVFYNEREWRYVPDMKELIKIYPRLIINKDEYNDQIIRENRNDDLYSFKLKFTPMDIKYIIINEERERLILARMIDEIKGDYYNMNDLTVLKSKIISVEQIQEDF